MNRNEQPQPVTCHSVWPCLTPTSNRSPISHFSTHTRVTTTVDSLSGSSCLSPRFFLSRKGFRYLFGRTTTILALSSGGSYFLRGLSEIRQRNKPKHRIHYFFLLHLRVPTIFLRILQILTKPICFRVKNRGELEAFGVRVITGSSGCN